MKFTRFIAAILAVMMLILAVSCGGKTTDAPQTETPVTETPETETSSTETPVTESPVTESPVTESPVTESPVPTEPTVPEETSYVFPENGVLKLCSDGKAPGVVDGRNPSFDGNKLVVLFDCATHRAGLDLADDCVISYTLKKTTDTAEVSGTSTIDASCAAIKNDYGFIGVCFPVDMTFDRYEKATLALSFTDRSGKEYKVNNAVVYKGLSFVGLDSASFKEILPDVETTVAKNIIYQTGTVGGTTFKFTIELGGWAAKTSAAQIHTIAQLFWDCYPKMHARFGAAGKSPTDVILAIEDSGYEIASTGGNKVHLHDNWLRQNRNDYDCLTHEFAHVIQNGWDGNFCEYSDYIERFADYCRYIYAFEEGAYNDTNWTLQTVASESTLEKSVRFLVWLDYFYSTDDADLIVRYFTACRSRRFPRDKWADAWAEIFAGTELEGKTAQEVFDLFAASDFAMLSSAGRRNAASQLLKEYDIRVRVKNRETA